MTNRSDNPFKLSFADWRAALKRSWKDAGDDNVGLIAAGVAFYAFLALVPLLGAVVLTYGLVAQPETVLGDLTTLTEMMPADAAKLIGEQLLSVVTTSSEKKGLGLLLAIALALFGARNGATATITALNIAYEEKEQRGFIAVNLLALGMTAMSVVAAIVAVFAIGMLAHLETLLAGAPGVVILAGKLLSYVIVIAAGAAGAATLYRYGPSRKEAKWTWLTPGSLVAALGFGVLTLLFGIYVANFGNYNATYGSLGAVVVLLTWIYLSAYLLLLGAELNSELERQTTADTTVGAEQPAGDRGAAAAADETVDTAGPRATPVRAPAEDADDRASTLGWLGARSAGSRAGRIAGGAKAGLLLPAAASLGLSLIRRKGRGGAGAAVLAGTAALAWLGRKPS